MLGVTVVAIDVVPEPVTPPVSVIVWLAVKYATLLAAVTCPLALTVRLLNVPTLALMFGSVSVHAPLVVIGLTPPTVMSELDSPTDVTVPPLPNLCSLHLLSGTYRCVLPDLVLMH